MFTTRPELQGSLGMVSSTHWLASAAGMAQLEDGGTAFDAVVAAGLVLQVVEPDMNGPGGDLPLIFTGPATPPTVLCAQGVAPAAATIDHFRDLGLDLVPGSGPLAAAVPGAFLGWLTILRDHGTRRLRDVAAAALHYASAGYPVLPPLAATIAEVADLFRTEWTGSAVVYLPDGAPPRAGEWLTNRPWARTLRRLVDEAERATSDRDAQIEHAMRSWSTGFVAEAVAAFVRRPALDSSGRRHAGVLTADDLAAWRPSYEPTVSLRFRGTTVHKTAGWGQGPVLLQQLALLDGFDLHPGTPDFVHTVVEVAKLAFADREAWYGDAQPVPLADLLTQDYTDRRRRLVGHDASDGLRPGIPGGRVPVLPNLATTAHLRAAPDVTTAEPTMTRGDTCHIAAADRFGNLIAATPSGGWLQSSPVIPDLGFPLGTRLQMTWLQDGLASSLKPGRRPRTTLSPTLAVRDDGTVIAFGTPGGDNQDQWQIGFLINHLVAGADLQAAIDAPAFHSEHFPSSFYPRESYPRRIVLEERFDAAVADDLRNRGHDVVLSDAWSLGRLCAVSRDEDGRLRGAANPRGMQGYAVGR